MQSNPFTPNFGQVPMHIAGRTEIIQEIKQYLDDCNPGNPARSSILIGPRGTGKTALLSYFSEYASTRGWVNVNSVCIPGLQDDILQQSVLAASEFVGVKKGKKVTGVSIAGMFGIEWEPAETSENNWRINMTKILDILSEQNIGLYITIDEVTSNLDEMINIASIYQLFVREGRKIGLLMAGLPGEVYSLLNNRSVSFLRRSYQYTLNPIPDYEIRHAFKNTIEESGKKINNNALDMAVADIKGFPYMMQLVGYRAWENTHNRKEMTADDVAEGTATAKKDFEARVLIATLNELSAGDIAFLQAMSEDDGNSHISDIEQRLGKTSGYISKYRSRLLATGVIQSQQRGIVSFALPGLKEYLLEQF